MKADKAPAPSKCFPIVRLEEPDKAALRRHAAGEPLPRLAFVLVLDRASGEAHEAIVDLDQDRVIDWRNLPNQEAPYGQPPIMIEDVIGLRAKS